MKDTYDINELCTIKRNAVSWLAGHCEEISLEKFGQAVAAIKDLSESLYYCSVTKAMEEQEENLNERMGYRAPVREHSYVNGYLNDPEFSEKMRMGYRPERAYGQNGGSSRYGYSYDNYQEAKRHYTETKSEQDKMKMSEYSSEHLNDAIFSIREMWKDADPSLRVRMKADLSKLVSEM